mmetsp:Transcript_18443/g.27657  ORF Transcript_18443/g.27657 Transcript_18443/m.27657 type:complete len:213 (+) Transcript_18443:276-914(+)
MPPRSERDEQHLPSINDLSGLGRMSNTSDQTQTTMLDSISMASADIDVLQSEANSRSITHESPCDDYASAGNARDAHSADLDIDTVDSISDRNGNLNHLQNDRMIVDASPHNNPTLAVTALALAGQSSSSPPIAAEVPMDPVDHLESSKTPGSICNDSILVNHGDNEQNESVWPENDSRPSVTDNINVGGFRVHLEDGAVEILNEHNLPNGT